MINNKGIPIEVKKPFETVYEIKNEFPSFEEFMKTYEFDDKVVESYEDELEAKAVQGSQYGPGKSNFGYLCGEIKSELGSSLTCRVSCDSDYFYESSTYSGAIVYMIKGSARWRVSSGKACGRDGRAFYMIVRCTDGWERYPERHGIGGGIYHGYIIKDEFGHDLGVRENKEEREKNIINCGGFAWMPSYSPKLQFISGTLNTVDQKGYGGISNGSRELSSGEKELVEYCFRKYRSEGPSSTFNIPSCYLP